MAWSKLKWQNIKLWFPRWNTVLIYLSFGLALTSAWFSVFERKTDLNAIIFTIILGSYVLIILAVAIWREIVYARKARYAEAMPKMHMTIHCLRDAFTQIYTSEQNHSKRCIEEALSFFASSFSLITGVHCRSCIKTIEYEKDRGNERNFYVSTFARGSTPPSGDLQEPIPRRKKDWLSENSDFLLLFRTNDNKFISDNLGKLDGYQNSHWPDGLVEREEFIKNRKYDYISTIIWPIRKRNIHEGTLAVNGFLCIDSKTRGVFGYRYDVDVGAIFADSLYFFLEAYRTGFLSKTNSAGRMDEPIKKSTSG